MVFKVIVRYYLNLLIKARKNVMSGKISLPHKCPKCGVVAKTEQELDKIFGYRTKDGGVTNQSQCKKCR